MARVSRHRRSPARQQGIEMAETLIALTAAIGTSAASAGTVGTAAAGAAASAGSALSTLGLLGTGLSAAGTLYSGLQAKAGAEAEARQLKVKGDEEQAIGQRWAMQVRREIDLAQSRIQAVAAASGGGAGDASITSLMQGVEQQGNYNSMLELYQGNTGRNKAYASAAARRAEGRSALTGSIIGAAGGAASNLYKMAR